MLETIKKLWKRQPTEVRGVSALEELDVVPFKFVREGDVVLAAAQAYGGAEIGHPQEAPPGVFVFKFTIKDEKRLRYFAFINPDAAGQVTMSLCLNLGKPCTSHYVDTAD